MNNREWDEFLRLKSSVQEGLPDLAEQEAAYVRLKELASRVAPGFLLSDESSLLDEQMEERREADRIQSTLGGHIGKEQLIQIVAALNPERGIIQTMTPVEICAHSYLLSRYSGASQSEINDALLLLEEGYSESEVVEKILNHKPPILL